MGLSSLEGHLCKTNVDFKKYYWCIAYTGKVQLLNSNHNGYITKLLDVLHYQVVYIFTFIVHVLKAQKHSSIKHGLLH